MSGYVKKISFVVKYIIYVIYIFFLFNIFVAVGIVK